MKYTAAQVQELLRKLGDEDAEIVADDAADSGFDLDSAIKLIDEKRIDFHKPAIEASVRDAANSAAAGKFGGSMRRKLATAMGVPASELEKIKDDGEAIAYAAAKYSEKMGGDTEAIRNEYNKALEQFSQEKAGLEAAHADALKAANQRFYNKEFVAHIRKQLEDAPLSNTANRDEVAAFVASQIQSAYDLDAKDENGNVSFGILDRATKLGAKNKAGTSIFDVKEFAKEKLSPLGTWQSDMRQTNPADVVNTLGRNGKAQPSGPAFDTSKDPVQAARERMMQAPALTGN